MKKHFLALLCSLAIISTAIADDVPQASSPNNEHEELARYKAKDELEAANNRINMVWNGTTKKIRAALLAEQRAWLKQRENDCTQKANTEEANNSVLQETIKLRCMAAMTDPRTEELKQKIALSGTPKNTSSETATSTDNVQAQLKAMEAERESIFKTKGSATSYFSENCSKHLVFLAQAAQQGEAIAQSLLGGCYENGSGVAEDEAQAVAWYRKAAEQGYASGQSNLGIMYEQGKGVTKDETQAVAWFRKAAEQGYASGQSNLGIMYEQGKGVTKDEAQAVAWYRKAAEQGLSLAQFSLGNIYYQGKGVTKDEAQAVAWYRKAAEQGNAQAQSNLGAMYVNGSGVTKDETQAVAWFRKAAEQGYASGQSNLGIMYEQGKGVTKDEAQAVAWYRKAAEQGDVEAKNALEQLVHLKATEQKNISEQLTLQQTEGYTAIISCAFQGRGANDVHVGTCFPQSELKITKDNRSKIYSMTTLRDAGKIDENVLYVELPKHFSLMAQNSQPPFILDVKIIDSKGNILFEDQAGKYGVIRVKN